MPNCSLGTVPFFYHRLSTARYLLQTKLRLLCMTAVGPRAPRFIRSQLASASRLAADHRSASLCDVTAAAAAAAVAAQIDINDDRLLQLREIKEHDIQRSVHHPCPLSVLLSKSTSHLSSLCPSLCPAQSPIYTRHCPPLVSRNYYTIYDRRRPLTHHIGQLSAITTVRC